MDQHIPVDQQENNEPQQEEQAPQQGFFQRTWNKVSNAASSGWNSTTGFVRRKWSTSTGNEDDQMSEIEARSGGEMNGEGAKTSDAYEYLIASVRKVGKNDVRGHRGKVLGAAETLVTELKKTLPEKMARGRNTWGQATQEEDDDPKNAVIDILELDHAYNQLIHACNNYFQQYGARRVREASRVEKNLVYQIYSRASQEFPVLAACYRLAAMAARQKQMKLSEFTWNDIFPLAREYATGKTDTSKVQASTEVDVAKDLGKQFTELDKELIYYGDEASVTAVDTGRDLRKFLNSLFTVKTKEELDAGLAQLKTKLNKFISEAKAYQVIAKSQQIEVDDPEQERKASATRVGGILETLSLVLQEKLMNMEENAQKSLEILVEGDRLSENHNWGEAVMGTIEKKKNEQSDENAIGFDTVKECMDNLPAQKYLDKVGKEGIDAELVNNIKTSGMTLLGLLDEKIEFNEHYVDKIKALEAAYKKAMEENTRFLENHGKQGRVEEETIFRKHVQGFQNLLDTQAKDFRGKALRFRHDHDGVNQGEHTWHEVVSDFRKAKPILPKDTIRVSDADFQADIAFDDARDLPIFSDPLNPRAVMQGQTNDCYLISTLVALAEKDMGFVYGMIKDNNNGTATVRLYDNDYKPVLITVEKTLPAGVNKDKVSSNQDNCLWAYLIEKAAARLLQTTGYDDNLYAGYVEDPKAERKNLTFSSLNYGSEQIAAKILTGQRTRNLFVTSEVKEKKNHEEKQAAIWDTMIKALNDRKVVTCSTDVPTNLGIQGRHVYYVAQKGENLAGEETVVLQNPYGPGSTTPKYVIENNAVKEVIDEISEDGSFTLRKTEFLANFPTDVFILDPQKADHVPIGGSEADMEAVKQRLPKVVPKSVRKKEKKDLSKERGKEISDEEFGEEYTDRSLYPIFGTSMNPREVLEGTENQSMILSTLIAIAERSPGMLTNMIRDNNDGTATVRLFKKVGEPVFVTVKKTIPGGVSAKKLMKGGLWAILIEKAVRAHNSSYAKSGNMLQLELMLTGKQSKNAIEMAANKLGEGQKVEDTNTWAVILGALSKRAIVLAWSGVKSAVPGILPNQYYYVLKKSDEPVDGEEGLILYSTRGPGSPAVTYPQKGLGPRKGTTEDGTFSMRKTDYMAIFGGTTTILDREKTAPENMNGSDIPVPPVQVKNPAHDEEGAVQKRQDEEIPDPENLPDQLNSGAAFVDTLRYYRRRINDHKPHGQEGDSANMSAVLSALDQLIESLNAPLPTTKNSGMGNDDAVEQMKHYSKNWFPKVFERLKTVCNDYLKEHTSKSVPGRIRGNAVEAIRNFCVSYGSSFYDGALLRIEELKAAPGELQNPHVYAEFLETGFRRLSPYYKNELAKTDEDRKREKAANPAAQTADAIITRYRIFANVLRDGVENEAKGDGKAVQDAETPTLTELIQKISDLHEILASIMPQKKLDNPTPEESLALTNKVAEVVLKTTDAYTAADQALTAWLAKVEELMQDRNTAGKKGAGEYVADMMRRREQALELKLHMKFESERAAHGAIGNTWTHQISTVRDSEARSVAYFICQNEGQNQTVQNIHFQPMEHNDSVFGRDYVTGIQQYLDRITEYNEQDPGNKAGENLKKALTEYIDYLKHPFNKNAVETVLDAQSSVLVTHLILIKQTAAAYGASLTQGRRRRGAQAAEDPRAEFAQNVVNAAEQHLVYAPRAARTAAQAANRQEHAETVNTMADVMAHRVNTETFQEHLQLRLDEEHLVNEFRAHETFLNGIGDVDKPELQKLVTDLKGNMQRLLSLMQEDFTGADLDDRFLALLLPMNEQLTAYESIGEEPPERGQGMRRVRDAVNNLLKKAILKPCGPAKRKLLEGGTQFQKHKAVYGLITAGNMTSLVGTSEGNRDLYGGKPEDSQANKGKAAASLTKLRTGERSYQHYRDQVLNAGEENETRIETTSAFGAITTEQDKRLAYDLQVLNKLDYSDVSELTRNADMKDAKAMIYKFSKGTLDTKGRGREQAERNAVQYQLKPTAARIVDKIVAQTAQMDELDLSSDSDFVKEDNANTITRIYQFYDQVKSLDRTLKTTKGISLFDSRMLSEEKQKAFLSVWDYYSAKITYCFNRLDLIADEKYSELGAEEAKGRRVAIGAMNDEDKQKQDRAELAMVEKVVALEQSAEALRIALLRKKLKEGRL